MDSITVNEDDSLKNVEISREELLEILLNTQEQGQIMEQLIKSQIQVKDDLISNLYSQLEYYRNSDAERFSDQLMKALIKVHKDMKRNLFSPEWMDWEAETLRKEYKDIFDDMTDLLEQQNVDEYMTEPGETFDPMCHKAKIEETDDVSLDKVIKKSIKNGYRKGAKVLLPEQVLVYKYSISNRDCPGL